MKFPKDRIDIKLKMESGIYDLEIPMGENNFSKQLDRLIDLTSKDISRNRPTRQEKEEYQTIIEKFGDGGIEKFKNPERESTFDKVLAGSLKTIETISQTAGEETSQFVSSFIATMKSAINQKDQESMLQKDIKNILQILAKNLDEELVNTKQGGGENAGTTLNERAHELINAYRQLQNDIEDFADKRFKELFLKKDGEKKDSTKDGAKDKKK